MKPRVTLALTAALVLATAALADWDPGQPYKWLQEPDLSTYGIDIRCTEPFVLADDFECDLQGPITDIHLWTSWLNDYLPFSDVPEAVTFTLSIHKDIPADQSPTGYSMPGELLWMRTFQPGEFQVRVWASNIEEGWMDPPDAYFFPADWTCWQYNFLIDPSEAFVQQGSPDNPVVYWLDVQAVPEDPQAHIGWKTSFMHWNDNAVWGQGVEPYPGPWFELWYPPNHELFGQPIDLAFVITGEAQQDELDFGDAPDPTYPTLLASNGARHLIVPGVYLGAGVDAEVDGQPIPPALGDDLTNIDDEDGVSFGPLVPGSPVNVNVTANVAGVLDAWFDFAGDGSWAQASDQIFAALPLNPGNNALSFMLPAGTPVGMVTYARFRFSINGGLNYDGLAPDGEVEDYELFIEEEPPAYRFEFSLDIGSDIELSDPFRDGDEAADPGDVYWWQSAPIVPPGRDGFKDDRRIFINNDPPPDPPDPNLATAAPVGSGGIGNYWEYFDLDGHDQIDFSLIEAQYPIDEFPSNCVYLPKHLMVSFDDDMFDGWPAFDVPVTRPSPAGVSSYGTTAGRDEIVGVEVMLIPAPPPYPLMYTYPIADEQTVHPSMAPNPDAFEEDDDDVDSLDIVRNADECPTWLFSPDHEGHMGLDPGGIYEVTAAGPVQVIDEFFHLGISEDADIDAFELAFVENPEFPGIPMLALLYSVDEDDSLTGPDESGGLNPAEIFISWMTGFSIPFTVPLQDDVDALTIWPDSLEPTGACCTAGVCTITTQNACIAGGGYYKGDGTICTPTTCVCRGDTNCDGQIDFGDINPFVDALLNGNYCDGTGANADVNASGAVDFGDINPFVALLTTNPLPIICP